MVPTTNTKKTRFAFWRKAAPATEPQSPTGATGPKDAAITKVEPAGDTDINGAVTKDVGVAAVLSTTPTADVTVISTGNTDKENVDVPIKKSVLRTFGSLTRTKASSIKTAVKTAGRKAANKTKKVFCCFSKQWRGTIQRYLS